MTDSERAELEQRKRQLAAREGKSQFRSNVVALRARIAELEAKDAVGEKPK